jgi:predicted MPP superfamily phosphohydrolase
MNRAARLALEAAGLGAAVLIYGSLVEAKRLVRERWRIRLPGWPQSLDGLRVGVISDLHARGPETISLAQRAIRVLVDEDPDVVVIPGDFIPFWSDQAVEILHRALCGIDRFGGRCLGVPGNHDWWLGPASQLRSPLAEHGVKLLMNEAASCQGAAWVGIDSAVERKHRPEAAMASAEPGLPKIALWHEPDMADALPPGCLMQISGHSHGGQFIAPWGWAPVTTKLGARYRRGFHAKASTPVFVSSGLATTGPPSRLFCPPVVSVLTLGSGPLS